MTNASDTVRESLERIIANQREELRDRTAELGRVTRSATFWRESFESLADDVGELMRAAEAGKPITAADLDALLRRALLDNDKPFAAFELDSDETAEPSEAGG